MACEERMMRIPRIAWVSVALFFLAMGAAGQEAAVQGPDQPLAHCDSQVRSTYPLGSDDEIEISGPELDEFANKPSRIDGDGYVQVPVVGSVHVAGVTITHVEQRLN